MTEPSPTASVRRVAVIGAGAWGTTLAILAAENGQAVTLVAHSLEDARFLDRERRHPRSLPDVEIPASVAVEGPGEAGVDSADVIVLATPTQGLRAAVSGLDRLRPVTRILSAAKGLEIGSMLRPTEVIRSKLGKDQPVAALSGPNLATEIAAGKPATTVIASDVAGLAAELVPVFHSQRFRVYAGADMVGAEFGGALKNIFAIGAGIADGLDAGDNAKAAFLTRGIAEMSRLGTACGAQPLTFAGLSGIGDLIATCSSPLSRNYRVGAALARGMALADILGSMREVAEGVTTTRAARELGIRHGLDLPIIEHVHRVLFEGMPVGDAIARLMDREPAHE